MRRVSRRAVLPIAVVAVAVLAPAATAAADADLRVTASHDREPLLRASDPNTTVYGGKLTLTVRNAGDAATAGA
jgi:hypothetical protein